MIIAAVVKMVILLVNPKAYVNFAKGFMSKTVLVQLVGLILAIIVLYFLLAELTIVHILAVVAFTGLLILVGLAPNFETLIRKYEDEIKKGSLWKQYWLYSIIWIILIIWAAVVLFS